MQYVFVGGPPPDVAEAWDTGCVYWSQTLLAEGGCTSGNNVLEHKGYALNLVKSTLSHVLFTLCQSLCSRTFFPLVLAS